MILVMLGQIGSGKSVQAKRIAKRDNFRHFSVGTYVREKLKNDPRTQSGKLVDSRYVEETIQDFFEQNHFEGNVILDGFPRLLEQKEWLDTFLASHGLTVGRAIVLEVDNEEVDRRLRLRGRQDDRPDAISNRKLVYENMQQTVIPAYEADGVLFRVDGLGSVDEVSERIEKIL